MSLNDLQFDSSKKGSLSTVSENISETARSQPDQIQKVAPGFDDGLKRKKKPSEILREMKAEIDRKQAQAARESALLDSSLNEHSTSQNPKRTRSRSPEASMKAARKEVEDIDKTEREEDEIDELSSVQKARLRDINSWRRYPNVQSYTCAVSVNGLPIIGSTSAMKGYKIYVCFDNINAGLPGLRIIFKSNKPGKLDEPLASTDSEVEQFNVCYYRRHDSGDCDRRMINATNVRHFADGFAMDNLDRQIADACESDNLRSEFLVSVFLFVNHDELTGILNRTTWLANHGDAVKQNVLQLLTGQPYYLRLWMFIRHREIAEPFGRLL